MVETEILREVRTEQSRTRCTETVAKCERTCQDGGQWERVLLGSMMVKQNEPAHRGWTAGVLNG